MSIALERNSGGGDRMVDGSGGGFVHGFFPMGNLGKSVVKEAEDDGDSCSSSIGRNSDLLSDDDGGRSCDGEGDDTEVQSSYKGPLDTMDALEEVLPIRRGISKFYCGKSKSFTSLACATSSSSIKEIAKPENAYSRKRKNLLAMSLRGNGGGISKRLAIKSSRSTLALAVAMSSSESLNTSEESNSNSNSTCTSPPHSILPPLHPQTKPQSNNVSPTSPPQRRNMSSWRSFSLADLQSAGATPTPTPTPTPTTSTIKSMMGNKDNHHY